jgi:hypothetical protein
MPPSAHRALCWPVLITPAHWPVLAHTVGTLEGADVFRGIRAPLAESASDAKKTAEDEQIIAANLRLGGGQYLVIHGY